MQAASKIASEMLNNSPAVCHSNYIDKRVWSVLELPDDVYHKDYPIAKMNEDGTPYFTWEAKLDKAESKFRSKIDDDQHNLWDKYVEAKNLYLKRLNEDRKRDGSKTIYNRLPPLHNERLLKRFEAMFKKGRA